MSKFILFLFVAICAIQILSKPAEAAPFYDVSSETTEDPMKVFNEAMERAKTQVMSQIEELLKSLGQDLPPEDKEKVKE